MCSIYEQSKIDTIISQMTVFYSFTVRVGGSEKVHDNYNLLRRKKSHAECSISNRDHSTLSYVINIRSKPWRRIFR